MKALDLVERVFQVTKRGHMTRGQVLVLIALAKSQKPLHLHELCTAVKESRQTIQKAVNSMDGNEVRKESPGNKKLIVHLRQPGVDALMKICKTEKGKARKRRPRKPQDQSQMKFKF